MADVTTVEFSRPLAVDRLDDGEVVEHISATPEERAALAKRFSLVALDDLAADIRIGRRPGSRIIVVDGAFTATVVQSCVVTLEPVTAVVTDNFSVQLDPDGSAPSEAPAKQAAEEDDAPEPLDGDIIDMGEMTAQYLSLALDPYPRAPGAEWKMPSDIGDATGADGPFAALGRLRQRH